MPSRTAIAVIVLAAFFDSGGLNAGTPLAIASTPVSATEPPAKALSRSRIAERLGRARVGDGVAAGGDRHDRPADDVDEADRDDRQGQPTNR